MQKLVSHTVPLRVAADPIAPVNSPLRWVGGKAWMTSMLTTEIRRHRPVRYHEPFLGGGAVLLNMAADTPTVGSDINQELITFWRWLQSEPLKLYGALMQIITQYGGTKAGYLLVRDRFNSIPQHASIWDAAAFLYLNILCFNGIWRVNANNKFNVPFGDRDLSSFPSVDDLSAVSTRLQRSYLFTSPTFFCRSFEESIDTTVCDDAIFVDPPYYGTYAGYSKAAFGPAQQGALAEALRVAASKGVYVYATNSDTPEIRCMYSWASITLVNEPRRVAANGDRAKAKCVLIRSHPLRVL
jgi:DNA adenine methylase